MALDLAAYPELRLALWTLLKNVEDVLRKEKLPKVYATLLTDLRLRINGLSKKGVTIRLDTSQYAPAGIWPLGTLGSILMCVRCGLATNSLDILASTMANWVDNIGSASGLSFIRCLSDSANASINAGGRRRPNVSIDYGPFYG